jgi:hypothetical protein
MIRSDDDKRLWQRFKNRLAGSSPVPGLEKAAAPSARAEKDGPEEVDLLKLAAWIDGRLDDAEREQVEDWLAAEPRHLDLALSARSAPGLAAPWPRRAEARAAGLVAPVRPSLRMFAAAAAAVLIVALGGFEMGRVGSQWVADTADTELDLAHELGLVPDPDLVETLL